MTHTSGIYDFAASAYDPSIDDGFDAAIAADPTHRWTREEQLRFAVDHGEPYGSPGAVYCYSDTNANLVGELLERETGTTMGAAIRELVGYDRLGLHHTYQESIEPEPAEMPPWSHQYERDVDVLTIDPSVDLYGGGGLVSTCADLARFFRALLRGEVFDDPATLATMTTRLQGVPASDRLATGDDPDDAAHVPVPCLGGRSRVVGSRRLVGHHRLHLSRARPHGRGRPSTAVYARGLRPHGRPDRSPRAARRRLNGGSTPAVHSAP